MGNHLESNHSGGFGVGGSIGHIGVCGMTRSVTLIVVHCTATRVDADFTQKDLLRWRWKGRIAEVTIRKVWGLRMKVV